MSRSRTKTQACLIPLILDLLNPRAFCAIITEVVHPNDIDEHLQMGVESILMDYIALRAGYKLGYDHENLTFGAGLRFKYHARNFRLDVSYMEHEYLEHTLRYTLAMEL